MITVGIQCGKRTSVWIYKTFDQPKGKENGNQKGGEIRSYQKPPRRAMQARAPGKQKDTFRNCYQDSRRLLGPDQKRRARAATGAEGSFAATARGEEEKKKVSKVRPELPCRNKEKRKKKSREPGSRRGEGGAKRMERNLNTGRGTGSEEKEGIW